MDVSTSTANANSFLLRDVYRAYPSLRFCTLVLTEKYLSVLYSDKQKTLEINIRDIVGCHSTVKRRKLENATAKEVVAYLRIYSYPLATSNAMFNKSSWRQKTVYNFCMTKHDTYRENAEVVNRWICALTWLVRGKLRTTDGKVSIPDSLPPAQRLLLIVNPRGGPGRAMQIFQEQVVPMLKESGIQHELLITERVSCAKDYVQAAQLSKWDGIAVVSGDGILYEVFNGLMERDDWETAIKTPVGVVPGGSGNALAKTISYATGEPYDTKVVTTSILNLIRGRICPLDLVQIQTTTGPPLYSFLSVGWGLMADIDIESEKLRSIGEARFSIWALIRALGLRKYKGKLSFLPVAGYMPGHADRQLNIETRMTRTKTINVRLTQSENEMNNHYLEKSVIRSRSMGNDKDIATDSCREVELLKFHYMEDQFYPCDSPNGHVEHYCWDHDIDSSAAIKGSNSDSNSKCLDRNQFVKVPNAYTNTTLPPLDECVPEDWTVIEDEFVSVYVCHQTHLNSITLFAPDAKMDDGIMWLAILRAGVSRTQVITYLSSLQNADHINLPFVEFLPIHAFRLEPSENEGILTVDGEVIPCGPIQGSVLSSIARVMTC